jgi:hypothetical protein
MGWELPIAVFAIALLFAVFGAFLIRRISVHHRRNRTDSVFPVENKHRGSEGSGRLGGEALMRVWAGEVVAFG